MKMSKQLIDLTIHNVINGYTKLGSFYPYNNLFVSDTVDLDTGEVVSIELEQPVNKITLKVMVLTELNNRLKSLS